mgnify:CR=1 FL=1
MFLGLNAGTLFQLGMATATIASMMAVYWTTKKGVPVLGLEPKDVQLIARGTVMGALHADNIDDIMTCLGEPKTVVDDIEKAVGNLEHNDMLHVATALQNLGHAMFTVFGAMIKCDTKISARQRAYMNLMIDVFSRPD